MHNISTSRPLIRRLDHDDAAALFDLSERVRASISHQEYMHWHTLADFIDALSAETLTKIYFGGFLSSNLVSVGYLKYNQSHEELFEEFPTILHQDLLHSVSPASPVASLGGDMVHPGFRGQGFNTEQVRHRLAVAESAVNTTVAIVDKRNSSNFHPYLANNFNIVETGIDPADSGPIHFFLKPNYRPVIGECQKGR